MAYSTNPYLPRTRGAALRLLAAGRIISNQWRAVFGVALRDKVSQG